MDDILTNANKIIANADEIERLVDDLEDAATAKAQSRADYAKAIAIEILKLKNGVTISFEEQAIIKPTADERSKIAEAICYDEVFNKDAFDNLYKALIVKIDARKAIMNGYQSINKVIQ